MKLDSMKFWLCASLLMVGLAPSAQSQNGTPQEDGSSGRANELTLAGLRPGKDTLAVAETRYKAKYRRRVPGATPALDWADLCTGRALSLALGEKSVVQSVTVTALGQVSMDEDVSCHESARDVLQTKSWKTGRGLRLGDPRDRVTRLYGEPASSGPSTKGHYELELLVYAFDWAGSDVPQVMKVSCDRATGRVLEITLAFPSL